MPKPDDDSLQEKPRAFQSDPGRLRRETGADRPIGAHLNEAWQEADTRVLRAKKGPPPSEDEAELIRGSVHQPVELFSRVLLSNLTFGEQETYTIVPHGEERLEQGRISIGSPIGRALFQEYPGAVIEVKAPAGPILYRILKVDAESRPG